MRTAPAEDPADLTAGFWANPRAGALIEHAKDRQLTGDHGGALDMVKTTGGFPSDDAFQGRLPPGHAGPGSVVRVLFWPRDQVGPAHERWPTLVQTPEIEPFVRHRELENRQLAEDGVRVVMVPITVNQLLDYAARTNGDPLHTSTRSRLLRERYDQDGGLPWPPQRNEQCWCGSGCKYKRCCGTVE